MQSPKPGLSLLIPFLNEADNIPTLVARLNEVFETQNLPKTEILFINDGSTDRSVEVLMQQPHRGYRPRLLSLSRNFGAHAALRAGVQHAQGKYLGFLSADLQDPPQLIPQFLEKLDAGADLVVGERQSLDNPLLDRLFTRMFARLMQRYVTPNFPNNSFDVLFFNQKIQQELNRNVENNSSLHLQVLLMGFRQERVLYHKESRKQGKSKWTFGKKIKLLLDTFVAFSYSPIRVVSVLGITLSLLGVAWALYVALREILVGDVAPGWPTLTAILMLGFGLTNISLGIIAEYLFRTLDAARQRPTYIVDTVQDLPTEGPAVPSAIGHADPG